MMREAAREHSDADLSSMRAIHVHGDEQIRALWTLPARLADDHAAMNFTPERLASITARTLVVSGGIGLYFLLTILGQWGAGVGLGGMAVLVGLGLVLTTVRALRVERHQRRNPED